MRHRPDHLSRREVPVANHETLGVLIGRREEVPAWDEGHGPRQTSVGERAGLPTPRPVPQIDVPTRLANGEQTPVRRQRQVLKAIGLVGECELFVTAALTPEVAPFSAAQIDRERRPTNCGGRFARKVLAQRPLRPAKIPLLQGALGFFDVSRVGLPQG